MIFLVKKENMLKKVVYLAVFNVISIDWFSVIIRYRPSELEIVRIG